MTNISISGRCRCCLQEDPGLNIFIDEDVTSNIKLCDIYQDCTNIVLDKRKEKPQGLCLGCLEQMMTAYNFIKQCKDVHDYLNQIFEPPEKLNLVKDDVDNEEEYFNVPEGSYEIIYEKAPESSIGYHDSIDLTEEIIRPTPNGTPSDPETFAEYDNNDDVIDEKIITTNTIQNDSNISDDGFDCELCDTQTQSFVELENHYLKHNRKKSTCTICHKFILNIQRHMSKHLPNSYKFQMQNNSNTVFECSDCRKLFSNLTILQQHLKIHETQKNTVEKNIKPMPRTNINTTNTQIKVNANKKNYKQEKSGHDLNVKEKLKINSIKPKINSLPPKSKPLLPIRRTLSPKYDALCAICGESFTSPDTYELHIKEHSIKKFPCLADKCNQTFKTEDELNNHSRIHAPATLITTNELPFNCALCNKQFSQLHSLKLHMQFHKEVNKFECPICHEVFNRAALLTVHSRKHSGEMLYVCDVCGKAFNLKQHLDDHKLSHGTEQLFNCEICNETFPRKTTLLLHMKSHITELFKCNNCLEKFTKKSLFNQHVANCHSIPSSTITIATPPQLESPPPHLHQPDMLLSSIQNLAFMNDDNDLIKSAMAIEHLLDESGSISEYL